MWVGEGCLGRSGVGGVLSFLGLCLEAEAAREGGFEAWYWPSDHLLPVPNSNLHLPFWEGYPVQVRASDWEDGLTSGFDLVTHTSAIPLLCFSALL